MYKNVSIEAIRSFISDAGVTPPKDDDAARTLCGKLAAFRSQGEFAAHIINLTEGNISGADLTASIAAAFPSAKVGTRHGPHYLCLARTGKLKGTTVVPPKAVRVAGVAKAAAKAKVEALESRIAELEALLASKGDK